MVSIAGIAKHCKAKRNESKFIILTILSLIMEVKVGGISEFGAKAKVVTTNGKRIAIFKMGSSYYAIDEECTHAKGPLHEGNVNGNVVTCPWHGSQFDITNGRVIKGPAKSNVKSYKVTTEGNDIFVDI